VVEVVPAPFTSADAVSRTRALFERCGLATVLVSHEVHGFVFNRLQGALLREAYCLVRDGVATPADVDLIVARGLGRRWSVVGPFETVALNTRGGIRAHARAMGPSYERMGAERGQCDPWTPDLVERVANDLEERFPLDRWEERVAWRDDALIALERARLDSGLLD
jgi:3-hydroxyacyl-CoA dehydrogenase